MRVIDDGDRLLDVFPLAEAEIQVVFSLSSSHPLIKDRNTMTSMAVLVRDALKYASPDLRADEHLVRLAVQSYPDSLKYAAKNCRDSTKIGRIAISGDPQTYRLCGKRVQQVPELAEMAVVAVPDLMRFVPNCLRRNPRFITSCVRQRGVLLQHTRAQLPRAAIIDAVSQDGRALKYVQDAWVSAESKLQDDKDVVLAAVRLNGLALGFASRRLRSDREVVCTAVMQDQRALKFCHEQRAVLDAVRVRPEALKYAKEFRTDGAVVEAAFAEDPDSLAFAFKDAALYMVSAHGDVSQFAKRSLRDDEDMKAALHWVRTR